MNLNVNEWKEFELGYLFNVTKAFAYNQETFPESQEKDNKHIKCITRTAQNNGCDYYGDIHPDLKIEKGNCLTIGGEGVVCFYQSTDFVCGTNMSVLRLEELNEKIGLFLATIINHYSFGRFSYGRAFNKGQIEKSIIKLPICKNENGQPIIDMSNKYSNQGYIPDFKWMESYIETLNYKPLTTKNTSRNKYCLDISSWQDFCLDDLFEIKKGKRLTSEDQTEGLTPYIGAIDSNNGVANYIGQKAIHEGNTISLSYNGSVGEAFYQEIPFWATDDVNVLYFKESNGVKFNKYIALFICTVLKQEKYRYSYGRKWTLENMKSTIIKLPSKDNKPDYDLMDNYIRMLPYGDRLSVTDRQTTPDLIPHLENGLFWIEVKYDLKTDTWKEYKLGSLFTEIYKATPHTKGEIQVVEVSTNNTIRFITRTDEDNGCDCYTNLNDFEEIEKGNALIIGDTTATCFYQENAFVTGDHIVVCRADWLDKYTGLFIKTILEKDRYKYSYGRAFKMDLIKKTIIKLPCKNDGNPNWDFIRTYIKSLPYGDRI